MAKILSIASIILSAALAPTFATCGNAPDKLAAESTEVAPGDNSMQELAQELSNIKYTQNKDGRLQWELTAAGAQQALDGPAKLQQVKITYFSANGKTTVVTGDAGTYDTATNSAQLLGNVLVSSSDGMSLSTDSLQWDQKTELLSGSGEVRISRDQSVVRGRGFELSPEDESLKIFEVNGVIHKKEMNL